MLAVKTRIAHFYFPPSNPSRSLFHPLPDLPPLTPPQSTHRQTPHPPVATVKRSASVPSSLITSRGATIFPKRLLILHSPFHPLANPLLTNTQPPDHHTPRPPTCCNSEAQRICSVILDHLKRIHNIPQAFAHLAALLVPHKPVQVHGGEGGAAREVQAHHDHSCNPEEQDVVARLHHLESRGRVASKGGARG